VTLRAVRDGLLVSLVALIIGLSVAFGSRLVLVILGLVSLTAVFIPQRAFRAVAPFAIGLLFIMMSSSFLEDTERSFRSIALRILGIGTIILVGIMVSNRNLNVHSTPQGAGTLTNTKWLATLTGGIALFILGAYGAHGKWDEFVLFGVGLAAVAVAARTTALRVPYTVLRSSVVAVLVLTVAFSLLAGVGAPGEAVEQDRLRGVTANANTLGFFAFLLGGVALVLPMRKRWRAVLLVLATSAIVWSSSRASLLALALTAIIALVGQKSVAGWLSALSAAAAAITLSLVRPDILPIFDSIGRTDNSRQVSFTSALDLFHSSPLIGVGAGAEEFQIASSPFRAIAYAGVVGVAAILIIWVGLVQSTRKAPVAIAGFVMASLVHSIFEGWLLSPISPLLLIFLLVLIMLVRGDVSRRPAPARSVDSQTASF
jgi:hypothetical protein